MKWVIHRQVYTKQNQPGADKRPAVAPRRRVRRDPFQRRIEDQQQRAAEWDLIDENERMHRIQARLRARQGG